MNSNPTQDDFVIEEGSDLDAMGPAAPPAADDCNNDGATQDLGATQEDWYVFDFVLGLGGHLLPCVPASPDIKVVAGSALHGKLGKVPSALNREGLAHGLLDWQRRPILSNEIQLWQSDRRLNLCVRTGSISGIFALDVDVPDTTKSEQIAVLIEREVGALPKRTRSNSGKLLMLFRMPGVENRKRRIKLDETPSGPAIELLGEGNQCVVAGTHSSGVRYRWQHGLPRELPTLTLEQLNSVWAQLEEQYAAPGPMPVKVLDARRAAAESVTLTDISELDWTQLQSALTYMGPYVGSNEAWAECGYALLSLKRTRPEVRERWIEFSRQAAGYDPAKPDDPAHWWDSHERSEPRSDWRHLLKLARRHGWRGGATSGPDVFPITVESHEPAPPRLQTAANGTTPLSNVYNAKAVLSQQSVLKLSYDEFLGKVLVQWSNEGKPRPMLDEDITLVQIELQRMGMVRMTAQAAEAAMKLVSRLHTSNCVADWLNGLTWDRKRRLSLLMPRGFGTPRERYYVRAGRNLLIGMVARALAPGCQLDEAIVLEGAQGTLKSSALQVIGGEYFAELTAHPNSKDFEQQLCGVWLGEFAELNALRRPEDIARIKQFITCRTDHLRLPYAKTPVDLPRRVVLCGSTNESEWLHDSTGGRRFIPIVVGKIDIVWIKENREQLFAEAIVLYKSRRKWWIYPREATAALQEARTPEDPWIPRVRDYLHGRAEVTDLSALLSCALGVPSERQSKGHVTRLGMLLRRLGCTQEPQRRIKGLRRRPWTVPQEFAHLPVKVVLVQFPTAARDSDLIGGAS